MSEFLRRWTGDFICTTCSSVYTLANAPHLRCRYVKCPGTMRPFNEAAEFAGARAARDRAPTTEPDSESAPAARRVGDRGCTRVPGAPAMSREVVLRNAKGVKLGSVPIDDKHEVGFDVDERAVLITNKKNEEVGRIPVPKGAMPTLHDADDEEEIDEVETEEEDDDDAEEENDAGDDEKG